jgi:hypothetical protein
MALSQLLRFLGTGIAAAPYIPQIHRVVKEHCSAGISMNAYALWCVASIPTPDSRGDDSGRGVRPCPDRQSDRHPIVICVKKYERQIPLTHLHEAHNKQL